MTNNQQNKYWLIDSAFAEQNTTNFYLVRMLQTCDAVAKAKNARQCFGHLC